MLDLLRGRLGRMLLVNDAGGSRVVRWYVRRRLTLLVLVGVMLHVRQTH